MKLQNNPGSLALGLCFALFGSFQHTAQAASQANDAVERVGRLAINFDELRDWNPTWVFTDAMKIARDWLPQVPGSLAPWNTGAHINTDHNGWPILGFGQSASTLLFRELNGVYPGGIYNVFFDGSGTMEYGHDASLLQHVAPGHDRIFVAPSHNGMVVKISTSDSNNHIRNVRVIMPGFEHTYQSEPFHPEFLAAIEPFGALRFMQWQNTNFTTIQHWYQRPTPQTWTQSLEFGMAVEHMVDLANRTGKAPWFCMPHTATDDFVRQFARFVAQNLDPSIPAYVEYSNEVWNNQFAAFHHAAANGLPLGYGAGFPPQSAEVQAAWRWYADRSVQVLGIWTSEFQGLPGPPLEQRLVRVLASQHANPDVGRTILDHGNAYLHADAYAVAPYVGFTFGLPENQWTYIERPIDGVIADLQHELATSVAPTMVENVQLASERGLPTIAYEGGQHLAGVGGSQDNFLLSQKFIDVNRAPGMYEFYRSFLESWEAAGADFMTPYSFCGAYSSFGSWGHLEYLNQPLSEAHKHRALVDWANGEPSQPPSQPVEPNVFYFGTACQNLWMGHYGEPRVGQSLFVTVSNVPSFGTARLLASFTNLDFQGIPLPFDLGALGQPGCSLLVGDFAAVPAQADSSGSLNLELPIPADPALAGAIVHVQWSVDMPGFGPLQVGLSNALSVTIGS